MIAIHRAKDLPRPGPPNSGRVGLYRLQSDDQVLYVTQQVRRWCKLERDGRRHLEDTPLDRAPD